MFVEQYNFSMSNCSVCVCVVYAVLSISMFNQNIINVCIMLSFCVHVTVTFWSRKSFCEVKIKTYFLDICILLNGWMCGIARDSEKEKKRRLKRVIANEKCTVEFQSNIIIQLTAKRYVF